MGTCYVVLYSILLIDSDRINAGGDENAGRNRGVNRYVSCYIVCSLLYLFLLLALLLFYCLLTVQRQAGLGEMQRDWRGRRSNTGRGRGEASGKRR